MHHQSHGTRGGLGFTLIELLVVMSIILILTAVGFSLFGGSRPSVSIALPVVEGMVGEARAYARSKQTRVRLVFHNDGSDSENPNRYLRFIAIAEEEEDADGAGTGVWKLTGSDRYLTNGVFFDFSASEKAADSVEASNPPPDGSSVTGFGRWEEGAIEFTGRPEGEQPCFYLEFNAEGICLHEGSAAPGAAVVLSRGVLEGDGDADLDDLDKVGFIILRNGGTSLIRDTADFIN